jgi:hypothetical protein
VKVLNIGWGVSWEKRGNPAGTVEEIAGLRRR